MRGLVLCARAAAEREERMRDKAAAASKVWLPAVASAPLLHLLHLLHLMHIVLLERGGRASLTLEGLDTKGV